VGVVDDPEEAGAKGREKDNPRSNPLRSICMMILLRQIRRWILVQGDQDSQMEGGGVMEMKISSRRETLVVYAIAVAPLFAMVMEMVVTDSVKISLSANLLVAAALRLQPSVAEETSLFVTALHASFSRTKGLPLVIHL